MTDFIYARYEENFSDLLTYGDEINRDVVIDFIGGETLMYPEMLDELCLYAHWLHYSRFHSKRNLTFNISTNGTLIVRQDVRDFLLKWKNHISLGFSIDGTKEIHDDCRIILFLLKKVNLTTEEHTLLDPLLQHAQSAIDLAELFNREHHIQDYVQHVKSDPKGYLNE